MQLNAEYFRLMTNIRKYKVIPVMQNIPKTHFQEVKIMCNIV